jgi:hypothetical protein
LGSKDQKINGASASPRCGEVFSPGWEPEGLDAEETQGCGEVFESEWKS